MAQTTYTRVLPNLTRATREVVYEKLAAVLSHLPNLDVDLLSISLDVPTRTLTVTLTNPVPADQLEHLGLS